MHPAAQEVGARAAAECAEVVTAPNFVRAMFPLLLMRLTRGSTTSRSAAARR
jgi:hypothetical protein